MRVAAAVALTLGAAAAAVAMPVREAEPAVPRGTVVVDTFWSQALGVRKQVVVYLPPSYGGDTARRYPVAYYLHGAWGDETNWTRVGRLEATLDSLAAAGVPEMIVVMPDGDDGFYTTWNWLGDYAACRRGRSANAEPAGSYCVPWPHYDDYIARDLVGYVDRAYRTVPDRAHRGVAGLSMGGYGAVALALGYPDVFSAAASHSGVVAPAAQRRGADTLVRDFDLAVLERGYGRTLWRLFPPVFGKDSMGWNARDPLRMALRLQSRQPAMMPALFVDCGTGDAFIGQNRAFRDGLRRARIPVEYAEHDGGHTWDYWRRHAAESAAWLAHRVAVR